MGAPRKIRLIQGERDKLKLSELTPNERLVVLETAVREAKPLFRHMPSFRQLPTFTGIDEPDQLEPTYGEGLDDRVQAMNLAMLLSDDRSERGSYSIDKMGLLVTRDGGWVVWSCAVRTSTSGRVVSKPYFWIPSKRELLDAIQGEPGQRVVREAVRELCLFGAGLVKAQATRLARSKSQLRIMQKLSEERVDLFA